MIRWIHRLKGHTQTVRTGLTVSLFDPSSKGVLIKCSCSKVWAK